MSCCSQGASRPETWAWGGEVGGLLQSGHMAQTLTWEVLGH